MIPILATDNEVRALARYRDTALAATKQEVKATQGNVYGLSVVNVNTVPVYVKFYNAASANVTVGTTTPQHVVAVPAGDGTTPGLFFFPSDIAPLFSFGTGCTIAAVTGLADNSTAAPSTAIMVEIQYK